MALTDGTMVSGEACASISDAQGNLLFYTNGIQAWNKLHQPLANGLGLGGYAGASEVTPNSATQGVAVVARPGSTTEYYIFALDAAENGLRNGLVYSTVDMGQQGGLGEVVSKAVSLPVPAGDGRMTEKMAIVRHANQRDIWIVVHGWNSNVFYSFLLTGAGINSAPVLSAAGNVHQTTAQFSVNGVDPGNNANKTHAAIGCMKISPDGRGLALAQYESGQVQVFDFNCGTGTVSNPRTLDTSLPAAYGVAFSPNSNLVYACNGSEVRQYDLLSQQKTRINPASTGVQSLQLGPDGKIYGNQNSSLSVIATPDQLGVACGYTTRAVELAPNQSLYGLPAVLVRPPVSAAPLITFGVMGTEVCVGETTSFAAAIFPALPGAAITWDFGEPASGNLNTAVGAAVGHRYASAGSYSATMTVRSTTGVQYTYTQVIRILTPFTGHIQVGISGGVLCTGSYALLSLPSGYLNATVTWSDGSHGLGTTVRTSGTHWVDVSVAPQCTVRDSVRINFLPGVVVRPIGPDRKIPCNGTVVLNATSLTAGTTYRWQDGSTKPTFTASLSGSYFVTLTGPNGCTGNSAVRLTAEQCAVVAPAVVIPNVITPNGDTDNEWFKLQGVDARTATVRIYNRWGKAVYEQESYANNWNADRQPAGLYYYWVFIPATKQQYKGWMEVIK